MKWNLKKVNVNQLKEWEKNPRQLTKKGIEDLTKSIKKFGIAEPLVCNSDLTICGGHGRLKVIKELGISEVDIYLPEKQLTDKQFEELNIRLNRNIAGTWDFDILANEFESDELIEWGFEEKEFGIDVKPWRAEDQEENFASDNDGIIDIAGYRLASMWYGLRYNTEASQYLIELPMNPEAKEGATVKLKYSRTNPDSIERIIKTYMREGNYFFEMCCGWMTFSSIAKFFGFSGKGGDVWDVSINHCKKQIREMPGSGVVEVINADCRNTGEKESTYDFVHSNPPFFNLEPYGGEEGKDLAALGGYELWLDAMGDMGAEAERILKPGGIANFVINDFREKGRVIMMHADFIKAIEKKSNLILHDFVVSEVISQALRFRKHDYDRRRTVKCHEYVITFIKTSVDKSK